MALFLVVTRYLQVNNQKFVSFVEGQISLVQGVVVVQCNVAGKGPCKEELSCGELFDI